MLTMDIKAEYTDFLINHTQLKMISDGVSRLTTPILDFQNDKVEIYIVTKNDGSYLLTDDGTTLDDLRMSGVVFEKGSRRDVQLNNILNNHGISTDYKSLYTEANKKNMTLKLYFLSQAIQKVSDLYVLNRPTISNIFSEDVKTYFDELDIRYTKDLILMGRSNIGTKYDFVIPRSKNAPERLVQTVNSINLSNTKSFLFGWLDTAVKRDGDSTLLIIYNDEINQISKDSEIAVDSYDVTLIPWSKRDSKIELLTA